MKKTLSLLLLSILLFSCTNPVYKKRKKCKGNGSWYGNRNLGSLEKQDNQTTTLFSHLKNI